MNASLIFSGVTFSSERDAVQSVCGTVFAFNDQDIRLWTMDGEGIFNS